MTEETKKAVPDQAMAVNTSNLPDLVDFLQEKMKPNVIEVTDPKTGTIAPMVQNAGGSIQALPDSMFDEYRDTPKRRKGVAVMLQLGSFIDHVNRFKNEHTAIFADDRANMASLTAVLDYHEKRGEDGAQGSPNFGGHRTSFNFPLSDEWEKWLENDRNAMSSATFARFLEDQIVDVMPVFAVTFNPEGESDEARDFVELLGGRSKLADPAKLMQIANGLQVLESSNVTNAQNLATGEMKVDFETTHDTRDATGTTMVVPSLFAIAIPVFSGGEKYRILARLRYRKEGSKVVFFYELWRADSVFKHAFEEAVDQAAAETQVPVFIGNPE